MHSDMHPVYVLYFMYFDTWKQLKKTLILILIVKTILGS